MIKRLKEMPSADVIRALYPMDEELQKIKAQRDAMIKDVFTGESDKFLVLIGPCSADNEDAVYNRMISDRNQIAAALTAEGELEASKIRNETDKQASIILSEAEAQAEKMKGEAEAEYMRILSAAYSDEARSDFYTFVLSLDAAKTSLTGENKTLILTSESPIAQIFNTIE